MKIKINNRYKRIVYNRGGGGGGGVVRQTPCLVFDQIIVDGYNFHSSYM